LSELKKASKRARGAAPRRGDQKAPIQRATRERAANFLDELKRAADAPVEPEQAARFPPWDSVLDRFIHFLNETYADALRAFRKDGDSPGVVRLLVHPRGRRNDRNTLLVFRFSPSTARIILDSNRLDLASAASALEQWLVDMVRTQGFRRKVEAMRAVAKQPLPGVLHEGGGLGARRPSTDVLVTISPDQQSRLADACETQATVSLRVHLAGPGPGGKGTYVPGRAYRWLAAGGYWVALDPGSHVLEADVVQLTGTPADPTELDALTGGG